MEDLYIFHWPSELGGADTRLVHTLPILAELMDVTLIPNHEVQLKDKRWTKYLDSIGVEYGTMKNVNKKKKGFALSMGNELFFTSGRALRAKEMGLSVMFSNEMMTPIEGSVDAVKIGVVDHILYVSEFNRKILQPIYKKARSTLKDSIIENYIDPKEFPFKGINQRRIKAVGRLSRPDPLKYPENFPLFYETLPIENAQYRIMAWSDDLKRKYNWHSFDDRWKFYEANGLDVNHFLNTLDVFVYPLGQDFKESWGRSVVEAMLTGLPVVAPHGHHFNELIVDERSGFLCKTYEDYQEACRWLEDREFRSYMSEEASKRAREVICNREVQKEKWRRLFYG